MKRVPVAILGATGMVGQRAIALLRENPRFEIVELAASDNSAGNRFQDATKWRTESPYPKEFANTVLKQVTDVTAPFAISALPAEIAREAEPFLAAKGCTIFSNASAWRMDSRTPLLIPEINRGHLVLVDEQESTGKIITNPNCSTVFIAAGLAPLQSLGDIEHVHVTTLQALSGAGYPGVSAFDLNGNIVPFIPEEEEKIEAEVKKILGTPHEPAKFGVTAYCTRVPVLHGHTAVLQVRFKKSVAAQAVRKLFIDLSETQPDFYQYSDDSFFPQPARQLSWNDQRVYIGRVKAGDADNVVGLITLGHNLVRGAAGAAIANMEAFLDGRPQ